MTTISDSLTIIPKGTLDVMPYDKTETKTVIQETSAKEHEKAAKAAPEAAPDAKEAEDASEAKEAPKEAKKARSEAPDDTPKDADEAHEGDEPLEERSERGYKLTITRERNRRRTVEEANLALQEQLRQTLALAQKFIPQIDPNRPEPKPDAFDSTDAYVDALADWRAERKMEAKEAARQRQEQELAAQKVERAHQERMAEAEGKYPGLIDASKDPTLPINDAMGAFIKKSKAGPDVLHYLVEHRDEAKRLYAMDPVEALAELGEIRAKVLAPQEKPKSKAPPPIDPVGGNNSVKRDILDMDGPEYWAKYEKKRLDDLAALQGRLVIRR